MKAGIKTTEFWLTIAMSVAKMIDPDVPSEAVYAVIAYVLARAGVKSISELRG